MKKLLTIAVVLTLIAAVFAIVPAFADEDLNVNLVGIKNAEIIGEYQKDGVNYYLVEKGEWTWVVSAYLDVITGIDETGGVWDAETLELRFDDGDCIFYPANFDQVLFNLSNMGAWAKYWNE